MHARVWEPFAEGKSNLFQNQVLAAIALKHEEAVGQVVLRWLILQGVRALGKSVLPERTRETWTFSISSSSNRR